MSPTPEQVLDLALDPEDVRAANAPDTVATVREFLVALLVEMFTDSNFSGKRPWGNSGWGGALDKALIGAGWVEGSLDEHGYIDEVDEEAVDRLMLAAITHLGRA